MSKNALHFTSKAENPETIIVKTEGEWDFMADLDWLTAEKQENDLIVTAQPSRLLTDREGVITITSKDDPTKMAQLQVTQDHGTPKIYDYFVEGSIPIEHLSPNGRYVAGEWDVNGVVIDLYQIGNAEYKPAIYGMENTDLRSDNSFMLRGVDDSGKPFAKGVTADGSTTVKFERNENGLYAPYVVRNGASTPLDFPETYMTGELYQGVYVDLISADGQYILGRINADGSTWIACKWTLNGTSYNFSEIASDLIEYNPDNGRFAKFPEPADINGLSVMGHYSCGVMRVPQGGTIFNPIPAKYTPYFYNMSDETITVLEGEEDARASFVTDDGTLFCATPYNFPFGGDRTAFVYKNGTKQAFSEWVEATYGLDVEDNGVVTAVAKDYGVVVWFTFEPGTGYVNHFIIVEP
ncbi:MAG: BACON domain-containing protein [Prevotellaceae bacterium]|nr:BACON domain-containing protein [Prevotellaceae bacterium]